MQKNVNYHFLLFLQCHQRQTCSQVPVKTEHFNSSFGDGATQEEASARVPKCSLQCHDVTMLTMLPPPN